MPAWSPSPPESTTVRIPAPRVPLEADLTVPADARGVVVFAHGSGSTRRSPRNREVARVLEDAGMATVLLDLLTPEEAEVDARTRHLRFDIDLLTERVAGTLDWCTREASLRGLGLGIFGASTGAAAALAAAAQRPEAVRAVVSRGGRPDLAQAWLSRVEAPTLLLVGGRDDAVLALNRDALEELRVPVRLEVVPGATHLFEEPGALELVASLATDWFAQHLNPQAHSAARAPRWVPPRRDGPHRGPTPAGR